MSPVLRHDILDSTLLQHVATSIPGSVREYLTGMPGLNSGCQVVDPVTFSHWMGDPWHSGMLIDPRFSERNHYAVPVSCLARPLQRTSNSA